MDLNISIDDTELKATLVYDNAITCYVFFDEDGQITSTEGFEDLHDDVTEATLKKVTKLLATLVF